MLYKVPSTIHDVRATMHACTVTAPKVTSDNSRAVALVEVTATGFRLSITSETPAQERPSIITGLDWTSGLD